MSDKIGTWKGVIPYCSNCYHDALEHWASKIVKGCGPKGRYCRSNYCPTCGAKMKNSEWGNEKDREAEN